MILLIPLGGTGERFKKHNYKEPKALIKILGKPILFYLLDNLNFTKIDIVIIPYNKEYIEYNFEKVLKKYYPSINFYFIPLLYNTIGALDTIRIALNNYSKDYNDDKPILCLDGDNFYTCDIVNLWNGNNIIFTINDTSVEPIYSYIEVNNTIVTNIIEKKKISDNACCGAYGFSSYKMLLKYCNMINSNSSDEYYISWGIANMINSDIIFNNIMIKTKDWYCLGTPQQLILFHNNYKNVFSKKLRFCFDLDNTLVTYPTIVGDYSTVLPIDKNINYLKYLKSLGHTIIIYTARRMKTHNGNIGKIIKDIGNITFETLEKYDIPYDEIYFGKPYADYYIDDLAINSFDNIEKQCGIYYNIDTIEPRNYNKIVIKDDMVIKSSVDNIYSDLSGEIYYYQNIPIPLRKHFPKLINIYNKNSYCIEKINGMVVTNLYCMELLTVEQLKKIMNTLKSIQDYESYDTMNISIYGNYCNKLKKRYNEYDYSKFDNSEIVYRYLYDELKIYENNMIGKKTIIHGDPVFSNIIVDCNNMIRFIDMRGKIENEYTIYGDWLYDWGKMYQSLCGYDSIMICRNVSTNYSKLLKNEFKKYFIELYDESSFKYLELITKSFLFTLIPIHNNEKCYKYYDLILNI